MAPKPKKALKGSHKATIACSVAIRELLKVREKQAILTKRAKLLQQRIIAEGEGSAHGVRTFLTHVAGGRYWVNKKAHDRLAVVKDKKK